MSEPIQVGDPHFDADGMTRVKFRFKRPGMVDFHVEMGTSGNQESNSAWLATAVSCAELVYMHCGRSGK